MGTEYKGTASKATVLLNGPAEWKKQNKTHETVSCISWSDAIAEISLKNASLAASLTRETLQSGPWSNFCRGPENITLEQIEAVIGQDDSNYDRSFIRYNSGPMCFHRRGGTLRIVFCGIPFCSALFDCVLSDEFGGVGRYTGSTSSSTSGDCLPFNHLAKPRQHFALLPDEAPRENMCRSTPHVYRYNCSTSGTNRCDQPSHFYETLSILTKIPKDKPFCLVNRHSDYVASSCLVPSCKDVLSHEMLRDSHGSPYLMSQLGHDLNISMLSCSVGKFNCLGDAFEEVVLPNHGVCFKFRRNVFIEKSIPEEQMQLQLELLTDTEFLVDPLFAKDVEFLEKISDTVRGDKREDSMFKLLIRPPDHYPFPVAPVEIYPGERSVVWLGMQKDIRFDRPGQSCEMSDVYSEYLLHVKENGTFTPKLVKFKRSAESCMHEYIAAFFVNKCLCLPNDIPILASYFNDSSLSFCYNETNTKKLAANHICSSSVNENMPLLRKVARKTCLELCSMESYTARIRTREWLKDSSAQTISELKRLAQATGFPDVWSNHSGHAALNLAFLRLEDPGISSDVKENIIARVRKSLISLAIKLEHSYPHQYAEEEAYPLKNLMADMGGILGLWCGISVLTLAEVVELFTHLTLLVMSKFKWRRKVAVSKQ